MSALVTRTLLVVAFLVNLFVPQFGLGAIYSPIQSIRETKVGIKTVVKATTGRRVKAFRQTPRDFSTPIPSEISNSPCALLDSGAPQVHLELCALDTNYIAHPQRPSTSNLLVLYSRLNI